MHKMLRPVHSYFVLRNKSRRTRFPPSYPAGTVQQNRLILCATRVGWTHAGSNISCHIRDIKQASKQGMRDLPGLGASPRAEMSHKGRWLHVPFVCCGIHYQVNNEASCILLVYCEAVDYQISTDKERRMGSRFSFVRRKQVAFQRWTM